MRASSFFWIASGVSAVVGTFYKFKALDQLNPDDPSNRAFWLGIFTPPSAFTEIGWKYQVRAVALAFAMLGFFLGGACAEMASSR